MALPFLEKKTGHHAEDFAKEYRCVNWGAIALMVSITGAFPGIAHLLFEEVGTKTTIGLTVIGAFTALFTGTELWHHANRAIEKRHEST